MEQPDSVHGVSLTAGLPALSQIDPPTTLEQETADWLATGDGELAQVRGRIGHDAPDASLARSSPKAARAVGYADAVITGFFKDPRGESYLDVVADDGVRRTVRVRSKEAKSLLDRLMYEAERVPLGAAACRDALDIIDARARYEGVVRDVHIRIADLDGELWIDLGDDTWRAIHVSPDGWHLVDSTDVPVRFRRAPAMRSLACPVPGGSLDALRPFVRAEGDGFVLIVAFLVGTFCARGPYAALVLSGEQGSSKSTVARFIRALVDPSEIPLRAPPRNEHDLVIAANNAYVVALDNVSYLPNAMSDALCRLASGVGFGTRALFTDATESIFSAARPIIITGIEDVAIRGDLADRVYSVVLPRINEADRRTERELDAAFKVAEPLLLGALFDAVACGLARESAVQLPWLPRMADAARWVVACEPKCPWEPGAYERACHSARAEMVAAGIAGDVVASAVVRLFERVAGKWTGTMGELLTALTVALGAAPAPRNWPPNERALSAQLTRAAPLLRGVGIELSRLPREAGTGRRLWKLARSEQTDDVDNCHVRHDGHEPRSHPVTLGGEAPRRDGRDGRDGRAEAEPTHSASRADVGEACGAHELFGGGL